MSIPFAKVDCSGNEIQYVKEVIESGWLTSASKVEELEKGVREIVGCKYALAVYSCTSALHLALDAAGVGPEDTVFVPSMTFTASAEVVRYMGAVPCLLDVELSSYALSPKIVLQAIKNLPEVKFLIVVHYGGQSVEMQNDAGTGIAQICEQHGVTIIEDAAHAFPSSRSGRLVGNMGNLTCLSFYANKTMTTGEGGMLLTDNDAYAARVKLMRLHGIDRDVWMRFKNVGANAEYDVLAPGFKYNMPDINAAVGLAQLERLELMRNERQRCAEYYFSNLAEVTGLCLPQIEVSFEEHAWHLFPIRVAERLAGQRDLIVKDLVERGIGTSIHYKPLHKLTYYKTLCSCDISSFPNSEEIWNSTISLPIYNLLDEVQLNYNVENIKEVFADRLSST